MQEADDDVNDLIREHWSNLLKIKEKSEDDFDKNITAVAAGTLAITLTFHQVIVKADKTTVHWLLFASWGIFGFLMIFNLFTNFVSIRQTQSSLTELSNDLSLDSDKNSARIKLMNCFNVLKIVLLFLGLSSFLTYVIINMSSDQTSDEELKSPIGTRSLTPVPRKLRKNPAVPSTTLSTSQTDTTDQAKQNTLPASAPQSNSTNQKDS